jgi:hypothetical protein
MSEKKHPKRIGGRIRPFETTDTARAPASQKGRDCGPCIERLQ